MKKTARELEHEISEIELTLLDAKAKLSEGPEQFQEDYMRTLRKLPPGYIPLKIRRERVAVLEKKLDLLKQDLLTLQGAAPSPGSKFRPGELKQLIAGFAKRDGFKVGDTVPSTRVQSWLKEIKAAGKSTTAGTIRAVLSDLCITKEG